MTEIEPHKCVCRLHTSLPGPYADAVADTEHRGLTILSRNEPARDAECEQGVPHEGAPVWRTVQVTENIITEEVVVRELATLLAVSADAITLVPADATWA